jgi:hypothetical protein
MTGRMNWARVQKENQIRRYGSEDKKGVYRRSRRKFWKTGIRRNETRHSLEQLESMIREIVARVAQLTEASLPQK